MRDIGQPQMFPGEREAIQAALQAGKQYGYGNIMAYLQKAWALHLLDSTKNLGEQKWTDAQAIEAVSNRSPYPLHEDFPLSFKEDLNFEP